MYYRLSYLLAHRYMSSTPITKSATLNRQQDYFTSIVDNCGQITYFDCILNINSALSTGSYHHKLPRFFSFQSSIFFIVRRKRQSPGNQPDLISDITEHRKYKWNATTIDAVVTLTVSLSHTCPDGSSQSILFWQQKVTVQISLLAQEITS